MYLRETRRRNRDGSEVAYLALAHNERDRDTGVPKAQIIHNFGRADRVDREGLARLVKSISRFLDPADAVAAAADGEVVILDGLAEVDEDSCYRAMDVFLSVLAELQQAVFFSVANLLNLEVDSLFFDTSSTYWETEATDDALLDDPGDDAEPGDESGRAVERAWRTHGHSKDHRPDLPQVVIGMAVTREGIPVRVW